MYTRIFRSILIAFLMISMPYHAEAQILKAVKALIKGGKEGTEKVLKTTAKEGVEESAEMAVKGIVKSGRAKTVRSVSLYKKGDAGIGYRRIAGKLDNLVIAARQPYTRVFSVTPTSTYELRAVLPESLLHRNFTSSVSASIGRLNAVPVPKSLYNASPTVLKKSASKARYGAYKDYFRGKIKDVADACQLSAGEQKQLLKKIEADPKYAKIFRTNPHEEASKWKATKLAKGGKSAIRLLTGNDAYKSLSDLPDIQKLVADVHNYSSSYFKMEDLCVEQVGKIRRVYFRGTNASIEIDGKIIKARPGSFTIKGEKTNGEVNRFLCQLLPNRTYSLEDGLIQYSTDRYGRVVSVKCYSSDLYKKMHAQNKTRNDELSDQVKKQFFERWKVSNSQYDYGHLVRREIGGPNETINALPMKRELQRSGSKWFDLENQEVTSCELGKEVISDMKIKYYKDHYEITVTKKIDGKKVTAVFKDLF